MLWLLVVAHPDDECMFFYPALQSLLRRGEDVEILCLSNGGAAGLGERRSNEMHRAADRYGVTAKVLDDIQMQDGESWDCEVVARRVERYLESMPHEMSVLTFDAGGASGHSNHVQTWRGVSIAAQRDAKQREYYQLVTCSMLTRFLGPFSPRRGGELLFFNSNPLAVWTALGKHESQFVWYRKIFLFLSAYSYLNRVSPIVLKRR